jgi:beta-lactamase superfamily II metal-dependent hydrolase
MWVVPFGSNAYGHPSKLVMKRARATGFAVEVTARKTTGFTEDFHLERV